MGQKRDSLLIGVTFVVMAAILGWTFLGGSDGSEPAAVSVDDYVESVAETGGSADVTTPIVYDKVIDVAELPGEALDTLSLIDADGPYPYDKDGTTFQNREGRLPDHPRGYYREFTVETPGLSHRGAKRIVTGEAGEYYWTGDHYDSFAQIVGW